jgi:hypothetical protein
MYSNKPTACQNPAGCIVFSYFNTYGFALKSFMLMPKTTSRQTTAAQSHSGGNTKKFIPAHISSSIAIIL